MADQMFSETFVPVGGKRGYTVLVSIVSHSLIIGAVIMVPVMASDMIVPVPYTTIIFRDAPLPPAPPPIARPSSAPRVSDAPSIPITAPEGIADEPAVPSSGDTFGDPDLSAGLTLGETVTGLLPSPPAPVVDRAPVPVGGNIQPPTKVKDAAPIYPAIARSARVEGLVIIQATISPTGKVQDVKILRSIPLLDAAAIDAVRQWEYTPTRLNGTPVAVVMTVTVNFRLQ
jgi:protein TonB